MDEELLGSTPYGVAVRRGGQVLFLPPSMSPTAAASEALSAPISDPGPPPPPPQEASPAKPPPDAPPAPANGLETLANPLAGLGAPAAPGGRPAPAGPDPFAAGAPEGLARPGGAPAPAAFGGLADLANPLAGLGAPLAPPSLPTAGFDPLAAGAPEGLARPPGAQAPSALPPPAPPQVGIDAAGGQDAAGVPGLLDEPLDEPTTPYQDEQSALVSKGLLAKERADAEKDLVFKRNVDVAISDAQFAVAEKKIDQRIEDLTQHYDTAIKAKADYNAKLAKRPEPGEMSAGKIFALILGGLGAALNRDPRGLAPVIDVLNARAEREADRRIKEQDRLDSAIKDRVGQLVGAMKHREGLTERRKIEKGAILEEYAREAESIGKYYEGETALQEGLRLAAGIRKEAYKDAATAAKDQTDQEIRREAIRQEDLASRRTAAAASARLALDAKKWDAELPLEQRRVAVQEAQLAISDRNAALEAEKVALDKEYKIGERRVFGLPQVKIDDKGQPVTAPDGTPVFERTILRNSDGKEFIPPTKEEAQKARLGISDANKATLLIDQLVTLVEENGGWSPDLMKSAYWQKAQSTLTELIAQRKSEGDLALGVLAGPDMGLLEKNLGGDPTGVRDPTPALKAARNNIVLKTNAALVGMGYDGPTFAIPEITPSGRGKPKNTPAQDLLEAAQARGEEGAAGAGGINKQLLSDEDFRASFGIGKLRGQDPRAFPTRAAAAAIAEIGRMAANKNTPPDAREQYVAALRQLANDPSPVVQNRVRTMAAQLGINLGDGYNPPKVGAAGGPVSDEVVPKDLLRALELARERGGGAVVSADARARGIKAAKQLSPSDNDRVLKALADGNKTDSRPEYFPTARANIGIGKLLDAALKFDNPAVQQWAQRQLEQLALTDPSPIVRRRIKRAAKEKGIQLRGGDAAASAAGGGLTTPLGAN